MYLYCCFVYLQVSSILKRKAEILEGYESNMNEDRKRICSLGPHKEVNALMWEWFQKARSQNIPISGSMMQERALLYAKNLGISEEDFKASTGWLKSFRQRHNINLASIYGEGGSVSVELVTDWKSRLPLIVSGYDSADIFNIDETGLFFRALPDKTLIKEKDCKGGKKLKERITVCLCVNISW